MPNARTPTTPRAARAQPRSGAAPAAPRIRPVPAVQRASAILFYLADAHDDPRGVSRIARDLSMVPSSCMHILRELVAAGLARFEPEGKTYSLGPGILTLARKLEGKDSFVRHAQPHLERIGRSFGVKANASMVDNQGHIVVVASTHEEDDVHLHVAVGQRVPMLASATGRLIAAHQSWSMDELRRAFAKVRWQRPIEFERWYREVENARIRQLAIDDGWYRRGITIIAVPVPGRPGRAERFIGALAVKEQLDAATRRNLARALQEAAHAIARALAYQEGAVPPAPALRAPAATARTPRISA